MARRKHKRRVVTLNLATWRRVRDICKRAILNTPVVIGIEGGSLVTRIGDEIVRIPLTDLVDYQENEEMYEQFKEQESMAFDRTPYVCPDCGKEILGAIAFRKHVGSDSCRKEQRKKEKSR